MIVLRDDYLESSGPSAVAIGVFDGLHRGHQKVLDQLCQIAERHKVRSTVVTFDPHPALVLAPERAPFQIATLEQRVEGLERLGVEQVRILNFDEQLAHETAVDFIDRVLLHELKTKHVVVGEDFHFGHNRDGNVELLRAQGALHDFIVHPAPIHGDGERWSSTQVRESLQAGDLAAANATLGRPFTLRGSVIHGDARGRDLGYRTANMGLDSRQLVPGLGIYAGAISTPDDGWWPAAISVGTRPQFHDDGVVLVEVHIPGFDGDLYDEHVDVAFLEFLRGEAVFSDTESLVAQIDLDVERTLAISKKFTPDSYTLLR
jgi:riboflavin kinase/FMN adenylyltransferase